MERRPFIIDTDCGVDDAVAIMMALAAEDVEVVGVTAVAGNVSIDHVLDNLHRLLAYFGHEQLPIYEGAHRSLLGEQERASAIHGENGLGNVELPKRDKGAPGSCESPEMNAASGLRKLLYQYPGATVVALGPLTNLAIAFALYPELVDKIGRLVVMGGALDEGNVTRFAEFNFYADPEAVQCVLGTGISLELLPWDACLLHRFSPEDIDAFEVPPGKAGDLFRKLQEHIYGVTTRMFGAPSVMHADPFAIACAIDSGVVSRKIQTGLRMELGNN
ncbi:MAG: nucleoside hydrolase, partial [Alkalispirochaetaceae bacterium]